MTKRTFSVQGMNCAHCQTAVTKALKSVAGVVSAEVDLARQEASIGYDEGMATIERLAKAVDDAGYRLVPV